MTIATATTTTVVKDQKLITLEMTGIITTAIFFNNSNLKITAIVSIQSK